MKIAGHQPIVSMEMTADSALTNLKRGKNY